MKCFVIFAALAVIGFISATPADDAAEIKSEAAALGDFLKTAEKASAENTFAAYMKEITRYNSNIIAFTKLQETKYSLLGTPGNQYWLGLADKIKANSDLSSVWGSTQIRAKINAYLAKYNTDVVKPLVSSLNALATKVGKNATAELMTCYEDNNNMLYGYNLGMIADQVTWSSMSSYIMSPLDTLNMDLKTAINAPDMNMWSQKPDGCMDPNIMSMHFDDDCVLAKNVANEANVLAAYLAYRTKAVSGSPETGTTGWSSNLDSDLQMRQWSWSSGTSMMSSTVDQISQCMTNWTPPPTMPPTPPMPLM